MFEQQIELGVQLLDDKYPGWLAEIDLETLDIAIGTKCIIGQLTGDYIHSPLIKHINPLEFGFTLSFEQLPRLNTVLTKEWKAKILSLRGGVE